MYKKIKVPNTFVYTQTHWKLIFKSCVHHHRLHLMNLLTSYLMNFHLMNHCLNLIQQENMSCSGMYGLLYNYQMLYLPI